VYPLYKGTGVNSTNKGWY